jgi:hypothetical protein
LVTLGAGTYFFAWSAPAALVDQHKSRLFNTTDSAIAAYGTSELATSTGGGAQTSSSGSCVVTISGSKAFAVQHQVQTTHATSGFGLSGGFGTEVYSRLEITKLG